MTKGLPFITLSYLFLLCFSYQPHIICFLNGRRKKVCSFHYLFCKDVEIICQCVAVQNLIDFAIPWFKTFAQFYDDCVASGIILYFHSGFVKLME